MRFSLSFHWVVSFRAFPRSTPLDRNEGLFWGQRERAPRRRERGQALANFTSAQKKKKGKITIAFLLFPFFRQAAKRANKGDEIAPLFLG